MTARYPPPRARRRRQVWFARHRCAGKDRSDNGHARRLELQGATDRAYDPVLTPDALEFVAELQREFGAGAGAARARAPSAGPACATASTLDFLPETAEVREGDWQGRAGPA